MHRKRQLDVEDYRYDNSMKIAMIGHKWIPSREGGIEVVVEELSKRLVSGGHKVHAYNRKSKVYKRKSRDAGYSGDLKEYQGIQLVNIPTPDGIKYNALVYSFLGTVRALFGHYDAIHYHAEGPCAMLWLPHLFGIRTVATIHGLDWQRSKWQGFAVRYLKFGEKIAAKYANEIIVLSDNNRNYFMNTYKRRVHYIPNGIVRPEVRDCRTILQKWGLGKDSYLLFLARIVPEKGLHYLVDAFKEVKTTKKLVIAGGSSHTDNYLKEIEDRAADDPRILFTGFIQGEELQELYSNAYLYILPSDLEGMPISLLEAMSYGNCCLVSDIPECTEVVEDKAVTFQRGNTRDLLDKLMYLIEHPELVGQYRETASNYICNRYNWDNIVKDTLLLYEKQY